MWIRLKDEYDQEKLINLDRVVAIDKDVHSRITFMIDGDYDINHEVSSSEERDELFEYIYRLLT